MKNLDLNAMGVQEMNTSEMQITDGGLGFILGLLIGIAISEILDRNASSDFEEGFNAYFEK